ncbi:MAG: Germination-specific N-acetylmuramoyl-L-alanine amidase precursor [Firmicutes bacterium ADurb.Bin193]|nr:MAG: Germination-specific N-acetylmuramoyl-L-alanine amidase precursor [Firmicutes bacterium ADurb.Bin193]
MVWKKTDIMIGCLFLSVMWMTYVALTTVAPASIPFATNTLVIDAGHGGLDGGSQGESGVLEKDLNLSVAFFLKEIAEADGMNVIMTRTEDKSLHTTESSRIRVQKRSDLEYRKKILNESGAMAFISIHMNKFEQSKYRGAQVFYAGNDRSKILGECIQQALIDGLNDGNTRVAKRAPASVYIFKNTVWTAVMVECGFLSNPEEEALLCQEEYQKRLAQHIYEGFKLYLTKI